MVTVYRYNIFYLVQNDYQNLQEKFDTCVAELENERSEASRLRREEIDRQMENRLAAEGFRTEINRLQQELRIAGYYRFTYRLYVSFWW